MEINPRKFDSSRWVVAAHFFLLGNFSSTEGLFFLLFLFICRLTTLSRIVSQLLLLVVCVCGRGGGIFIQPINTRERSLKQEREIASETIKLLGVHGFFFVFHVSLSVRFYIFILFLVSVVFVYYC